MTALTVVESDAVVVSMTRASKALAEAVTISQTKKIVDMAAAAEVYARRQHLSEEAERMAAAVKVEALRKLGSMLAVAPKNEGARGVGKSGVTARNPTLDDLGLTKRESVVAQRLASLPEQQFQQVRDGHVSVAKAIAAVEATRPAPKPAKPEPKPAPAAEDDDGPSAEGLLDEMAEDLRRAEARVAELEKALAADGKQAVADALRRVEHAERRRDEAMEDSAAAKKRADFLGRQLARCGKAVGQADLDKVAAAVEAMVRAGRKAA
jgi:hypothetical protein